MSAKFPTRLKICLGVLLSSTALVAGPVMAQTQTPDCPNGTYIIVDGNPECQALAATPNRDSLAQVIADFETVELLNNPIAAGENGDRAALRKLPDVSLKEQEAAQARLTQLFARHAALRARAMSAEQRLNHELLGFVLGQRQRLAPFDEARIPFTNDSGFFNQMTFIARQTKFETADDYEAYAARLTQLRRFFDQHKTNLRRGIKTGFTASADILPGIQSQIETLAKGSAKDHPLYAPFKTYPDTFSAEDQARLSALGEAAVKSVVLPAYRDLKKFFDREYVKKARTTPGLPQTEEARNYYRALVHNFTTLPMDPDEVHALGLSEVARIRAEMDGIIKEVEFKGSFAAFLTFLRTDPQFYAKTEEELLMYASWVAKQIDGKMPEFFETLPRLPYGVMAVPAEIAPNYTTGRYWGGSPDAQRAGFYVVNTYDLKARPLYNIPALTAHEGVPGHHHQIALGQELAGEQADSIPRFRRSLYPNAFGEGWGLYAEKVAAEMGIYKTPYERFGQLSYEMWRACRLVVDTGLHWKGWSREQAEQCFLENSALSESNIRTEVDRYISWPGQALAYKIGELKILELRRRAETALGEDFSIRRFHDAVLQHGGVPLDILEKSIERWIFDEQQARATRAVPTLMPISPDQIKLENDQ